MIVMKTYLEHANITVPDLDEAIAFLTTIEPEFYVRHRAFSDGKCEWAHVGNDEFYIALQKPYPDAKPKSSQNFYRDIGINHLGWVVENLEEVEKRLQSRGYVTNDVGNTGGESEQYRRRVYYFDKAGFEWELIEYTSKDSTQRNLYQTA
jgi:catechol 2,3-dioxygenase-like lactoylglutathione lyase family enzyme